MPVDRSNNILMMLDIATGIFIAETVKELNKEGGKLYDDPVILAMMTVNAAARKMQTLPEVPKKVAIKLRTKARVTKRRTKIYKRIKRSMQKQIETILNS